MPGEKKTRFCFLLFVHLSCLFLFTFSSFLWGRNTRGEK